MTAYVVQAAFRPAGGAWQAPERLAWAGESGERPSVAFDGHGDAFAVWEAYTGYTFIVEAAYRPADGSWGEPVELAPAEIPGDAHPRLAVDEQGDAIAIWNRGGPSGGVVQEAFMPAGGTWQDPVEVAEIGDNPQVAFDGKGDALALWYRYGTEEWFAQSAFKPAGGVWQPPVDVSTGKLALTAKIASRAKDKKKPTRTTATTIGTVSFSISGDETKTVKISLNITGRTLLGADHGRLGASLALVELAPGAANTQTKTVRLVQEKVAKGKRP